MWTAPVESKSTEAAVGRAMCYRCHRPGEQCVCVSLPRIANQTKLLLLQHPREFRHPLGTAKLLHLALAQAKLEICWQLQASSSTVAQASSDGYAVLYPHPQAVALEQLPVALRPKGLIVLDGTWPQARVLYRHNPWLTHLPHVQIQPDGIDRYRVRREPAAHCTSTVEAVIHALQLLEPYTPHLEDLLRSFVAKIDRHLASYAPVEQRRSRGLVYRTARARLPSSWQQEQDEHVVLCTSLPPNFQGSLAWQSLTCLAWRRSDNHFFVWSGSAGGNEADFLNAWQQFCPKSAVLLLWTPRTLQPLANWQPEPGFRPRFYVIKSLLRNAIRRKAVLVNSWLQEQGRSPYDVTPIPAGTPCRARLANLIGLIHALEQLPPWQPTPVASA